MAYLFYPIFIFLVLCNLSCNDKSHTHAEGEHEPSYKDSAHSEKEHSDNLPHTEAFYGDDAANLEANKHDSAEDHHHDHKEQHQQDH